MWTKAPLSFEMCKYCDEVLHSTNVYKNMPIGNDKKWLLGEIACQNAHISQNGIKNAYEKGVQKYIWILMHTF